MIGGLVVALETLPPFGHPTQIAIVRRIKPAAPMASTRPR
jgi:hypothetical protein